MAPFRPPLSPKVQPLQGRCTLPFLLPGGLSRPPRGTEDALPPRPAPRDPVGRIGFLGFLGLALEPPLLLSPYSQCWAPAVPVYLPFLEHSELFPTSSQAFALTCLSPP